MQILSHRPTTSVAATLGLVVAGLVLVAGPATAAPGGTFEMTALCNADGTPSSNVTIEEHFTGLNAASPHPSYRVSATRPTSEGTIIISDDAAAAPSWYPNADGSRDYTGTATSGYFSKTIQGGDSYHWTLYETYGTINEVLSGDIVVGGNACEPPPPPPVGTPTPPPHRASFTHSPASVRVSDKGRFRYRFDAGSGLHGKVTLSRKHKTVAHAGFVVPKSGVERAKLALAKKAFKTLRHLKHAKYRVDVVLTNPYGTSRAHTSVILRAPKR